MCVFGYCSHSFKLIPRVSDCSRIDYAFQWFHPSMTAPIQVSYLTFSLANDTDTLIGACLPHYTLLANRPLSIGWIFSISLVDPDSKESHGLSAQGTNEINEVYRSAGYTVARVSLIQVLSAGPPFSHFQRILGGMRITKFFTYEHSFLDRNFLPSSSSML